MARGLLVFSGEKQTRRSNFGPSGPRFTHLNTRHDDRQARKLAPPGPISQDFWILALGGTPPFHTFFADFRLARRTVQIAVSRPRAGKKILVGPDGSDTPSEPSGPTRILFMDRARAPAYLKSPRRRGKSGKQM